MYTDHCPRNPTIGIVSTMCVQMCWQQLQFSFRVLPCLIYLIHGGHFDCLVSTCWLKRMLELLKLDKLVGEGRYLLVRSWARAATSPTILIHFNAVCQFALFSIWRLQEAEIWVSSISGNHWFEDFNNNYTLAKQEKNERQNLYKGFPIKPDAECHAAYPISQLYKSTGLSIPQSIILGFMIQFARLTILSDIVVFHSCRLGVLPLLLNV